MSHNPLHPQLASQARRSILPLAALSLTCMLPQAQAGKVIIGAADNTAGGPRSVVAGGKNNTSSAGFAFIGAGRGNKVEASDASVLGGNNNTAAGAKSAVLSGYLNNSSGLESSIVSGIRNITSAGSSRSAVLSGTDNVIEETAWSSYIGGGYRNSNAGDRSAILMGTDNIIGANALNTVVAGVKASSNHKNSFVFNSSLANPLATTKNGQFLVNATGGIVLNGGTTIQGPLSVSGGLSYEGAEGGIIELAGPQGEAGPEGPKGDTGDIGITGLRGAKGDKGDAGPKGEKGDQGVPGQGTLPPNAMIFSFNANDPGIISQGYIQLPAPLITETAGDPDAPQFYVDYNSTQRNANRLAVWTGDEVIAWGLIRGNYDSVIGDYNIFPGGARYNPTYDNWTSMSSEGGPDLVADFQPEDPLFDNDVMPRALWTGNKMIIEGAGTNGSWLAYIYDPSTDSWSRPSTSGAPIIEFIAPESVWTGSKLIVWGVNSINDVAVLTGSVYDPSADSWSPMPNQSVDGFTGEDFFWMNLFITWAGSEMVLGGVEDGFENVLVTYSFDPQANEWSVIDRVNDVPFLELDEQEPIWTGSELIVGGVSNEFESETNVDAWEGYSFNPISRSWSKISSINAPIYGAGNLNVDENTQTFWTGSKMIVGATVANTENDEFTWVGHSYDPSTKSWTQLASTTLPKPTWYNGDQDNAYDFTLVGDQLCASPSTSRGFGVPSGNQDFKVYNIESNSWRVIEGSYTSVEQYSIIVKINALTNPAMLFLGSQQSSMFDPDTDGELAWRLVVSKYYGQKAFYLYSKP